VPHSANRPPQEAESGRRMVESGKRRASAGPAGPALRHQRDGLDLDAGAFGERGHLDGGAGGLVGAEGLGVEFVELGEEPEVRQEHGGLHHVQHAAIGRLEHRPEVGQDLLHLGGEGGVDQLPRGGVEGDLPGGVDEAALQDGLAVGPDGGGGLVGLDGVHGFPPGDVPVLYPAPILKQNASPI